MLAGGSNPDEFQHRGHHIDGMRILGAHLAPGFHTLGEVHDERIADPTPIGFTLPAAERRVTGPGPAPGIMVEGGRVAQFVDVFQVRLQIFFDVIEEQVFVDRTGRSAFGAGAVVGDQHDQGVLKLADRFQEVEQAAHMEVGVFHETGEDLHHVGV